MVDKIHSFELMCTGLKRCFFLFPLDLMSYVQSQEISLGLSLKTYCFPATGLNI